MSGTFTPYIPALSWGQTRPPPRMPTARDLGYLPGDNVSFQEDTPHFRDLMDYGLSSGLRRDRPEGVGSLNSSEEVAGVAEDWGDMSELTGGNDADVDGEGEEDTAVDDEFPIQPIAPISEYNRSVAPEREREAVPAAPDVPDVPPAAAAPTITCPECGAQLKSKVTLRVHLIGKHGMEPRDASDVLVNMGLQKRSRAPTPPPPAKQPTPEQQNQEARDKRVTKFGGNVHTLADITGVSQSR